PICLNSRAARINAGATRSNPCWPSSSSSASSPSSPPSTSSSSAGLTESPARPGAALVTGGARRIGRAICLELARAGFDVAIHYRSSADEAEAVAAEVRALGRGAAVLDAALADVAAAQGLVGRAVEALGPVAVLVNNASVFADDRLDTLTGGSWSAHLDANLRAPVLLAQVFGRQAPEGSSIIN